MSDTVKKDMLMKSEYNFTPYQELIQNMLETLALTEKKIDRTQIGDKVVYSIHQPYNINVTYNISRDKYSISFKTEKKQFRLNDLLTQEDVKVLALQIVSQYRAQDKYSSRQPKNAVDTLCTQFEQDMSRKHCIVLYDKRTKTK